MLSKKKHLAKMRQLYKVVFPVHIMPYKLDQLLLRDKVIRGKHYFFREETLNFLTTLGDDLV